MFPIRRKGVRQECILSPYIFNIYGEYIRRRVPQGRLERGLLRGGEIIKDFRYADDPTLIETIKEEMQMLLDKVREGSERMHFYLNKCKLRWWSSVIAIAVIAAKLVKLTITRCSLIYYVNDRFILVLLKALFTQYHASEKRQETYLALCKRVYLNFIGSQF